MCIYVMHFIMEEEFKLGNNSSSCNCSGFLLMNKIKIKATTFLNQKQINDFFESKTNQWLFLNQN